MTTPRPPSRTGSSGAKAAWELRSEEHTSELQSHHDLVSRLLLEKKIAALLVQPGHTTILCARISRAVSTFHVTTTTNFYTLSLHDALPISSRRSYSPSSIAAQPPTAECGAGWRIR